MTKKQEMPWWVWIIIVLLLVLLLNQQGVINIFGNGVQQQNFTIQETDVSEYSTCLELCSANGFNRGYVGNSVSDCIAGDTFLIYGYAGQPPLLSCCCFTHVENGNGNGYTCEESDGGFDIFNSGWCQDDFHNLGFIETCGPFDTVNEYFCNESNICELVSFNACPEGYTCFEGECVTSGYNIGDIVGGGSGIDTLLPGVNAGEWEIDLSDIEIGGPYCLGARIYTNWNYVNQADCYHIAYGYEGIEWNFFDSDSWVWGATDTSPQSHNVDFCPLDWDGQTNWELQMFKMFNMPDCAIEYDWNIEIYVCECP